MQTRRTLSGLVPLLLCCACGNSGTAAGSAGAAAGAAGQAVSNAGSSAAGTNAGAGTIEDGGHSAGGNANAAGTSTTSAGAHTAGGSVGSAGRASTGGAASTPSGLPEAPGPANLPAPSGAASNLKVVPWAGFDAAVTYTFDDSQPSQFEHWADLKATGARVTYYVTSSNSYIADFDETLKEVAAAGELGNHTVSHCNFDLTGCAGSTHEATIEGELDTCTAYLKKLGEPDTLTMAYPYGDTAYAPSVKSRFFLARGVGSGLIGMGDKTDPFNLPVFAAAGGEGANVFSGQIDSTLAAKKWVIFLFHSLAPTGAAWYATVDIGAVTGSIQHAQSLPKVWLDTVANVGAYWLGASLLQGAGPEWTWKLPAHFPTGKYLRVTVDGGTLKQGNQTLSWDAHGYYEVGLDAGKLSWSP